MRGRRTLFALAAIWLCRACLAVFGEPGTYHDGMVRWAGTNPTFQFDYYYWYPKR